MVLLQGPTGWRFLMSEVPLQTSARTRLGARGPAEHAVQGYLAHKKTPTPLGPP